MLTAVRRPLIQGGHQICTVAPVEASQIQGGLQICTAHRSTHGSLLDTLAVRKNEYEASKDYLMPLQSQA